MWLGEQISPEVLEMDLLIITAGIIANLPSAFVSTLQLENRRAQYCLHPWNFNSNTFINSFYCFC